MKNRSSYVFGCILVFIVLSGCKRSLTFDSKVVEVRRYSRNDIAAIIGADTKLPIVANNDGGDFTVISIRSTVDLVKFIKDEHVALYLSVHTGGAVPQPILAIPEPYVDGRGVIAFAVDDGTSHPPEPDESGTYLYNIVVFSSWNASRQYIDSFGSRNPEMLRDRALLDSPCDITIRIGAGGMLYRFESPPILVESALIANARSNGLR